MRRNKPFKALLIHLLSISMLFGPMPLLSAEADYDKNVNDSGWVGDISSALQTVGGAMMANKQKQMQMQQQAAMMNSARPQVVPAKYFPQCRISPAGASVPKQACQMSQDLGGSVSQAQAMQQVAQQNIDFYDQLLDEAQNSPLPNGIACLKQAMEGVKTSIKDRMNGLERMKEQIAKANQLFEEQNKAILEDIKRNGNELFGTSRGKKLDANQESADYNKLVSPECRDIIVSGGNESMNDKIFAKGLRGIRDGNLGKLNISSSQFVANKGAYEKDLNQKVQQIKSDIRKYGVENFVSANSGSLTFERNGQQKFGSLTTSFKEKVAEKTVEIQNIRANIKSELGGSTSADLDNLMRMDQNFKADFGEFANAAESQIKREYVGRCVSGEDRSGVSLSTDQILGSLRYDSTAMSGDTITNYRSALEVILNNSDASASEKQSEIKKLDGRFKGRIRIVYNDEGSVQRNETPYQMFDKIISKCEQVFEQKTDSNVGRSVQRKVKRAKKYMRDLQALERTFASDLTNHLIDEVVNCSGRSLKAGQCGPGSLDTSSSEFCLSQASDCAAQANSCFSQIDREVKVRQDNMNRLSTTYNNNVAALITTQEGILAQVKAQVARDSEFFKSFFPGATYSYPGDLFVKMPQLADFNGLGLELRGGGNIEDLQKLPEKIDLLKQQLQEQWSGGDGNKGIESVIAEYIASQAGAMEKNRTAWTDLQNSCMQTQEVAMNAINEQNKAAAEAYGEQRDNVNSFCQRFEDLRSNPAAGCGDDNDAKELYEDSMKISSHVNDDALRWVGTYKGLCAQSQNESSRGDDQFEDTNGGRDYLKMACEEGNSEEALAQIFDDIKSFSGGQLSSDELSTIDAATGTSQVSAITSELGNSSLKSAIESYVILKNTSTSGNIAAVETAIQAKMDAVSGSPSTALTEWKAAATAALNKLKSDQGFCNAEPLNSLLSVIPQTSSSSDFANQYKPGEVTSTPRMSRAGRALASLSNSTQSDPLSAMGQAEYADIECEATASNGRFGSGDFDFSLDPIGQSSLMNMGLGK